MDRSSWQEICEVAVPLDGMCARGGKAGNAVLLGFETGKMRTIFWNSTVTIAVGNACSIYDGFLQSRIPPAACKLRLCCPDASMGSVSLMPHQYYNAMKKPMNARAWTTEERMLSP